MSEVFICFNSGIRFFLQISFHPGALEERVLQFGSMYAFGRSWILRPCRHTHLSGSASNIQSAVPAQSRVKLHIFSLLASSITCFILTGTVYYHNFYFRCIIPEVAHVCTLYCFHFYVDILCCIAASLMYMFKTCSKIKIGTVPDPSSECK